MHRFLVHVWSPLVLVLLIPVIFVWGVDAGTWWVEWCFSLWGGLSTNFPVMLDKLSFTFCGTVLVIYLSVMSFSSGYMGGDQREWYFNLMVFFFVMSMSLLILVPHLAFLLIGWDLLGLTSYLLVVYYSTSSSLGAGMLTALSNRVGDGFLLLAVGWFFSEGVFSGGSALAGVSVALASMTKSAQIPFSAWLPAAMAAPTPVSALVHSSTLVTAGVYLLIRYFDCVSEWGGFSVLMLCSGVCTSVFASICACVENDLKKIIALSTLSQLGVMMVALGAGSPSMAFIHLVAHAFFKASLFISAGNVIHLMGGDQDIRRMGALSFVSPVSAVSVSVASFALCGLPFLAGFYSKDVIYEGLVSGLYPFSVVSVMVLMLCLTVTYSVRLMVSVMGGKGVPVNIMSSGFSEVSGVPLVLSVGGVVMGAVLFWSFSFGVAVLPSWFKAWIVASIAGYVGVVSLVGVVASPMSFLLGCSVSGVGKVLGLGSSLGKVESYYDVGTGVVMPVIPNMSLSKLLSLVVVTVMLMLVLSSGSMLVHLVSNKGGISVTWIKFFNPFHLVQPSPWPLAGSLSGMFTLIGVAFWFHGKGLTMSLMGLVTTILVMVLWWRDVIREGTFMGHHTSVVASGLRLGVVLFIVSEVCFFFAFFWAFFHSSLAPSMELGLMWPPAGINPIDPWGVPLLNTVVLLSSGVSVTMAHHYVLVGDRGLALQGLFITVGLGVIFTMLQAGEYYESSFSISDSVYGSTFFVATGFHGVHVIVGTIFLFVCLYRLWEYHFTRSHHVGLEAAVWYWHFVDVVWLFLFVTIYWWGSTGSWITCVLAVN